MNLNDIFNVCCFIAAAGVFTAPAPAAAQGSFGDEARPSIRSLDRTCLPAGVSPASLPMFTEDLAAQYQEIAVLDSFISNDKCEDTVKNQLVDLQNKGVVVGADALIRVRPLANKARGWHENKDTPFFSVKQAQSGDYFFRSTAIKYLKMPIGEPLTIRAKTASQSVGGTQSSPVLDTNRILKVRGREEEPREASVPEVLNTQPRTIAP